MTSLPEIKLVYGQRRAIVTKLPDGSAELRWSGGPSIAYADSDSALWAARMWTQRKQRPRVLTQRGLGAVLRADRVEVRP